MAKKKKSTLEVATFSVTAIKKYLDEDGLRKLISLIASKTSSMVNDASGDMNTALANLQKELEDELATLEGKVDNGISSLESSKQDKLTAGTGIEITSDSVINVTLDTTIAKVVTALPDKPDSGDENKIFMVLSAERTTLNIYTEYLWIDGSWEELGQYKSDIDLTPYLTKDEAASTYATLTDLATVSNTANSAYTQANNAYNLANNAYNQANSANTLATTANSTATSAYTLANAAYNQANSAYDQANTATSTATNAYAQANAAYNAANSANTLANTANARANNAYNQANAAYNAANDAQSSADGAQATADSAYNQANSAYSRANNAYNAANNALSYDEDTRNSVNAVSNTVQLAYNQANDAYNQANSAYNLANTANATANSALTNVSASGTSPLTLSASKSGTTVTISGSVNLSNYATTANLANVYNLANAAYDAANSALSTADSAYSKANDAYTLANTANATANTANTTAKNAYNAANTAQSSADAALSTADDAYAKANSAYTLANTANATANTANTTASNAYNLANSAYSAANSALSTADSKQDKLTAGTGISISNNTISCTLDTTIAKVVTSLPTAPDEEDKNKIFLVPSSTTGTQNIYTEYIYVDGAWEKLGEYSTSVDLSGYLTIANAANTYATQSDLNTVSNTANSAYSTANSAYNQANNAYNTANSANSLASTANTTAANAYSQANNAYNQANTANSSAGNAAMNANLAYNHANAAYNVANEAMAAVDGKQDKLKYYTEGSSTAEIALDSDKTAIEVAENSITLWSGDGDGSVKLQNNVLTYNEVEVATVNDIPTLSGLGGVGTINASGTSPLTLSASKSGTTVTITGSVDTYNTATIDSMINTATAGGLTSVTASGTSPLTLSANVSGTTATITGSVDLSDYATSANLATVYNQANAAYDQANSAYNLANTANATANSAVASVSASGTSPLTLSASKSGTAVTISGSVDLSDYAKTTDLPTLSGLGGVGSISTSATSPLSLSASKSGTTVTLSGSVDTYDKSTIDSMIASATEGGITNITASGTSPLTLNASVSGTSASISGSVDMSDYAKSADVPTKTSELTNDSGFITSSDIPATPTLSDLGGVGSVSASGTSPLSLSASKSGTSVSISGSVDLSSYAKTTDVEDVATQAQTNAEAINGISILPFAGFYSSAYTFTAGDIVWVRDDNYFARIDAVDSGTYQVNKLADGDYNSGGVARTDRLYRCYYEFSPNSDYYENNKMGVFTLYRNDPYRGILLLVSDWDLDYWVAELRRELSDKIDTLQALTTGWHPNLIKDGNFSNGDVSYEGKGYWWDRTEAGKLESDDTYGWHFYSKGSGYLYSNQQTNCCTSGTTYTISFYAWGTAAVTVYVGGASQAITLNSTATRYEITLTATSTASPRFRMTTDGETFYLALVKCEEGSSASAWSPHPSEIKLY